MNATTKSILCMQTYNSSKKYNVNYQQVQQRDVPVSIFQAKEYPKLHENFHCRLFVPNDKTIVKKNLFLILDTLSQKEVLVFKYLSYGIFNNTNTFDMYFTIDIQSFRNSDI